MYLQFYRLKENPFSVTPNSSYFYPAPSHEEALSTLRYGVGERKGFILMTGEVGVGKTTTIRAFLNSLDREIDTALVLNPFVSVEELLHTIRFDFNARGEQRGSIRDEIHALNHYLLYRFSEGYNAVVIIDEAQNLSYESMEMLRLLSNLETETDKLLQIILVGQPELEDKLTEFALRQLRQRIQIHHRLSPFNQDQTRRYITQSLERVGSPLPLVTFEEKAIVKIHQLSGGIPRLINKLCDYALLAGFVHDTRVITELLVEEGRRDIALAVGEEHLKRGRRFWSILWPFSRNVRKTCRSSIRP